MKKEIKGRSKAEIRKNSVVYFSCQVLQISLAKMILMWCIKLYII